MNKKLLLYIAPILMASMPMHYTYSNQNVIEAYDFKKVAKITVKIQNLPPGSYFDQNQLIKKLATKEGDPFSQLTFDQDLKALSEEYDRVEPSFDMKNGELYITLKVWKKPYIRTIKFEGNKKFGSKKLLKELGVKPGTVFNRDSFNKAFNKVKEFYIKKGFFESHLQYTIAPVRKNNEVDVVVHVHEGRSGHVSDLKFEGFTSKEKSQILEMVHTKKYNLFTSWLTGKGIFHEEALEQDKLIIIDFLQNQGYADAKVDIKLKETPSGLEVIVKADRGELFHFGKVSFSGNELYSDSEIEQVMRIHDGSDYSPEKVRDTIQAIKDLYGKKGYIETDIQYSLQLIPSQPVYNIHFQIEENEQYKVGMIRVLGNVQTNTSVILHESLLTPGETFDLRRLKATQQRLEAMGYFKSVNVYAIRASDDKALGPNYRDVIIEVDETATGNASLFFGFSSVDSIFGGLDLSESNFNYKGLGSFWRDGLSSLRGGGEYAHARVSLGDKQTTYSISWLTPYFRDTLWRVGFDTSYTTSRIIDRDYHIDTIAGSIFANYPLTPFWTYGNRLRLKNAIIKINKNAGAEALEQEDNSGLILGLTTSLNYDSTDNPYKPHRGLRTALEAELAGNRRHADTQKAYPFARFAFVNSYYYPVWRKGTLKARLDTKFIYPFGGNGDFENVPLSERFFLGGGTTVRGYDDYKIGPKFRKDGKLTSEPQGGISSTLVSLEYLQNIYKPIDVFVFFDGGSVSTKTFDLGTLRMSYGGGLRLEINNRMPVIVGYGVPINPGNNPQRRFFFAMGGQF